MTMEQWISGAIFLLYIKELQFSNKFYSKSKLIQAFQKTSYRRSLFIKRFISHTIYIIRRIEKSTRATTVYHIYFQQSIINFFQKNTRALQQTIRTTNERISNIQIFSSASNSDIKKTTFF